MTKKVVEMTKTKEKGLTIKNSDLEAMQKVQVRMLKDVLKLAIIKIENLTQQIELLEAA